MKVFLVNWYDINIRWYISGRISFWQVPKSIYMYLLPSHVPTNELATNKLYFGAYILSFSLDERVRGFGTFVMK